MIKDLPLKICVIMWRQKFNWKLEIGNFLIDCFSTPYHGDCDSKGGSITLFVRQDTTSNLGGIENKTIESLYLELNMPNDRWLHNYSYNPDKSTISTHINKSRKSTDLFSVDYEKSSSWIF